MPEISEPEPETDKYERGAKKAAVGPKVRLLLDLLIYTDALIFFMLKCRQILIAYLMIVCFLTLENFMILCIFEW